jgi:hypothetical protein
MIGDTHPPKVRYTPMPHYVTNPINLEDYKNCPRCGHRHGIINCPNCHKKGNKQ